MKKDIVVYTAISNGYDGLRDPLVISEQCDYICFTDNKNIESSIWQIREFPNEHLDDVRKCRQLKILPHRYFSEYKYSIWVDGNIEIINNLQELVENQLINSNFDLLTFQHPSRNCIYEEAEECVREKKDNIELIRNQIQKYSQEEYPLNNGLVESNVILRKHNSKELIDVMEQWWEQVKYNSRRDQLSFNYVSWKSNFKFGFLTGSSRSGNDYFRLGKHKYTHKDIYKYFKYKFRQITGRT